MQSVPTVIQFSPVLCDSSKSQIKSWFLDFWNRFIRGHY